jgi:NADH dehydrogenase (ubiquinone) 1 beta subcomplex subunit 7
MGLIYSLLLLQNERHTYEKCQYEEFKKRVKKMEELREAKGGRSGLN